MSRIKGHPSSLRAMTHLQLIDVHPEIFAFRKLERVPPYHVNSVKNVAEVCNGKRRGRQSPRAKHVSPFLILVADGVQSGVVSIRNLLYKLLCRWLNPELLSAGTFAFQEEYIRADATASLQLRNEEISGGGDDGVATPWNEILRKEKRWRGKPRFRLSEVPSTGLFLFQLDIAFNYPHINSFE